MLDSNVSLFLPPAEMQLVWNCVMEQPGKAVYPILRKMHQQFIEQGIMPDDRPKVDAPLVVAPILE